MLVKPGGARGLDAEVCRGKVDFPESFSEANDAAGSSGFLLLLRDPFVSLESSIRSLRSKPCIRLPGFIFWLS